MTRTHAQREGSNSRRAASMIGQCRSGPVWSIDFRPSKWSHLFRQCREAKLTDLSSRWTFPWASSFGGDFNSDFNVRGAEEQQREGGVEYNCRREAAWKGGGEGAVAFAAMSGTDVATTSTTSAERRRGCHGATSEDFRRTVLERFAKRSSIALGALRLRSEDSATPSEAAGRSRLLWGALTPTITD